MTRVETIGPNVLFRVEQPSDTFEGTSLIKAESTKIKEENDASEGYIVHMGETAFDYLDTDRPKVGDYMLFKRYVGANKAFNGVEYRIVSDVEVFATLRSDVLTALGENVVVKVNEIDKVTKGGIYLPDDKAKDEQYMNTKGELISCGPHAFVDCNKSEIPPIGTIVIFKKYSGITMERTDGLYRILPSQDIILVEKNDE